ncbi:glycoside hydrolase family 47 protein [Kocuria palustris]|nr:glycoside hydrolase family 47 protein [Kocuria palustris]
MRLSVFAGVALIGLVNASLFTGDHLRYLQNETRALFEHGWQAYIDHGFPYDEVTPLTCQPFGPSPDRNDIIRNDALGNALLMVLDNLDLLIIFERWDDLEDMLGYLKERQYDLFDQNQIVQVFEFSIRLLGGLISAHLLLTDVMNQYTLVPEKYERWYRIANNYDGFLLDMAFTLGKKLLTAFKTTTQIPVPRINLKKGAKGVPKRLQHEGCTLGVTTPVLEMTLLSRLTGDELFEAYTQQLFWKLWLLRTPLELLPMLLDPITNKWVDLITGIGALIDLFYEYAVKGAIVLRDSRFWEVFDTSYRALITHLILGGGPLESTMIWRNVNTHDGTQNGQWIDSLAAFWPGLQVLAGRIKHAVSSHWIYTSIWNSYGLIPERWRYAVNEGECAVDLEWYPLRPEYIELTYYLYRATRDPMYLHIGEQVLEAFKTRFMAPCGFAGYQDVRSGARQDRMETFVLGETLKYLYLLFDVNDEIFLHTPIMALKNWVFSTEAHPIWMPRSFDSLTPQKVLNDSHTKKFDDFGISQEVSKVPGYDMSSCERPDVTKGLRSNYYLNTNLFSAQVDFQHSWLKPVHISGEQLEIEPAFFSTFLMGLSPTSNRRPTLMVIDVFLGDITHTSHQEISRILGNDSRILSGDFWVPQFTNLKVQFEHLAPGKVDVYNNDISAEYITARIPKVLSNSSQELQLMRVLKINGIEIPPETMIWISEENLPSMISTSAEGGVFLQNICIENVAVL